MNRQRTKNAVWSWEVTGAICCFVGGMSAALLGSALTASTWILGAEAHPWVRGFGTALLILTIPLLILAGYCMDWAEQKEPKDSRLAGSENGERGSVSAYQVLVVATFLIVGLIAPFELRAQQTIFNVPTTDVLDKGKVYGELDMSLKPTDGALVSKFSSFVPRVVLGAGSHVEVGLNVTGNVQPGPDATTLVPTIKWNPYQGKDNGWAFVVGDNLFFPVRNRGYNMGNYVYAEMSKTFKGGTRVTFGGYDFTRNVVLSANRAGGQFGFEQPINKKVTFAADWFTGKHAAGYFTPGVIFKLGRKATGYAGYSIGNQNPASGNHFFLLELGYNFN
jgi:hypothetical protein